MRPRPSPPISNEVSARGRRKFGWQIVWDGISRAVGDAWNTPWRENRAQSGPSEPFAPNLSCSEPPSSDPACVLRDRKGPKFWARPGPFCGQLVKHGLPRVQKRIARGFPARFQRLLITEAAAAHFAGGRPDNRDIPRSGLQRAIRNHLAGDRPITRRRALSECKWRICRRVIEQVHSCALHHRPLRRKACGCGVYSSV